jgi:hypothetical protein
VAARRGRGQGALQRAVCVPIIELWSNAADARGARLFAPLRQAFVLRDRRGKGRSPFPHPSRSPQ